MGRAKRKRDHERMVGRAWDCGIEGRAIRLETGRMNQTIARLKKQLALEQRRRRVLQRQLDIELERALVLQSSYPDHEIKIDFSLMVREIAWIIDTIDMLSKKGSKYLESAEYSQELEKGGLKDEKIPNVR